MRQVWGDEGNDIVHYRNGFQWVNKPKPTPDLALLNRLTLPPTGLTSAIELSEVKDIVCAACEGCTEIGEDGKIYWDHDDDPIFCCIHYVRQPDHLFPLKVIYSRARQESTIWDIFSLLLQRGFVTMKSLVEPIDADKLHPTALNILRALQMFEATKSQSNPDFGDDLGEDYCVFPLIWVAVVIARGCYDTSAIYDTFSYTGFLGKFPQPSAILVDIS